MAKRYQIFGIEGSEYIRAKTLKSALERTTMNRTHITLGVPLPIVCYIGNNSWKLNTTYVLKIENELAGTKIADVSRRV